MKSGNKPNRAESEATLPLLIKPVFEAGTAEQELNQWGQRVAANFGNLPIKPAIEKDGFKGLDESTERTYQKMRKIADEAEHIGEEAKKSTKALSGMFEMEKLEQVKGAFGDLKDIFDGTAVSLFGFSQESADAIVKAGDLAEKGFGVGAVFGPLGAVVGAGVGGALGYFSSQAEEATKQAAELEAKTKKAKEEFEKLKDENEELVKSFSRASSKDIPSLIGQMKELDDKILDASKHMSEGGANFEVWLERFGIFTKAQADEAGATAGLIQGKLGVALHDANEALFGPTKKSKSALKEELADLVDPKNGMSIAALQKQLGDLDVKIRDFGDTSGLSTSGSFVEGWAKDADELNSKLAIAIARKKEIEGELKGSGTSKNTSIAKETKESADALQLLNSAVIGSLGRDGVEAAAKLKTELINVRDIADDIGVHVITIKHGFDELRDVPLPQLGDMLPDAKGTIDPIKAMIQELFGIVVEEGSNADMALNGLTAGLKEVGGAAAGSIGGAAAGAFGQLFDEMAANEKQLESFGKGFARKAADALRSTGSELIGDGIANELKAAAMFFIPGMQGTAAGLAAMGGAEIAAGAAMGGVGISVGRRVGKAPEREDRESDRGAGGSTGGSRSSSDNGTRNQSPIIVNMQSLDPGNIRAATQIGEVIHRSLETFRSNGGMSFPY